MKRIVFSDKDIDLKSINKTVIRVKCLIENDDKEILIGFNKEKEYQIIGGHLEDNESLIDCLRREVLEETGIEIKGDFDCPFITIEHICKDYPNVGDVSDYISYFYIYKTNDKPNINKVKFTDSEKEHMFNFKYIKRDEIINILKDGIEDAKNKVVILDTIEVLREYIYVNED